LDIDPYADYQPPTTKSARKYQKNKPLRQRARRATLGPGSFQPFLKGAEAMGNGDGDMVRDDSTTQNMSGPVGLTPLHVASSSQRHLNHGQDSEGEDEFDKDSRSSSDEFVGFSASESDGTVRGDGTPRHDVVHRAPT